MHGTGIDLDEIPGLNGNLSDEFLPSALMDHLRGVGAVMRALADDDCGAGLAVQHIPALGFAQGSVLMYLRISVIRMHLDA